MPKHDNRAVDDEADPRIARELVDEGDRLARMGLWNGALSRYGDCLKRFEAAGSGVEEELERARAGRARALLEVERHDEARAAAAETGIRLPEKRNEVAEAPAKPEPKLDAEKLEQPEPEAKSPTVAFTFDQMLAKMVAQGRVELEVEVADSHRRTAASLADQGRLDEALEVLDSALDELDEGDDSEVVAERAALLGSRAEVLRKAGRDAEADEADAWRKRLLDG
jgi:tetratricopeptide (TPR) repeat protein